MVFNLAGLERILNLVFVYTLSLILFGSYVYQFALNKEPCPLCLLQRIGMLGIACSLLLNLRFGIRIEYYGLAILSALLGRIVSLRQIGLHICPDFPCFGEPIFGIDLYIWSFMIFSTSIFACAVLLILRGFSKVKGDASYWGVFEKLGFWTVFFLVITNAIITFMECGLSLCATLYFLTGAGCS
ncbi:MAG: hypothetical protein ACD_17C00245G0004 [uncultured bacterium]|nr:MAG: hypothetical protein ACD_17C00245G0004 [uncultured bacterium]